MMLLQKLTNDDNGQGIIEFSMLLGVVALVLVALAPSLRTAIECVWTAVINLLYAT